MKHKYNFLLTAVFVLMHCIVSAQNWDEVIKLTASERVSGERFGRSVAISGKYAIVGAADASGDDQYDKAGAAFIFMNINGAWVEVQKIFADDRSSGDHFGYSVAISGDFVIVGAYLEKEYASDGQTVIKFGSAYIFKNNNGLWVQVQKINAAENDIGEWFGYSVAILDNYVIVGAPKESDDANEGNHLGTAGAVYIFKNNEGNWIQVQKIVPDDRDSGDFFGSSVAISGEYTIVGAYNVEDDASGSNPLYKSGAAYIFKNNSGIWEEARKIVADDRKENDKFGYSVGITDDYAIVGAHRQELDRSGENELYWAGAAYIFKNNEDNWEQVQKIISGNRAYAGEFGCAVAISNDHIIVGAFQESEDTTGENPLTRAGTAYIFKNNNSTWELAQKIVADDRDEGAWFGYSVAISNDNTIIGAVHDKNDTSRDNYLAYAGSAYIFNNLDVVSAEGTLALSNNFILSQNYPNPFNPSTVIEYSIPSVASDFSPSNTTLKVYDILGNEVAELVNEVQSAGNHSVSFNASSLSSGIYLVRLTAGNFSQIKKMTLLK